MNWPFKFFNLVHFEEFFQKKSGHPKFVGNGTEYANRSDNFPRFIYIYGLFAGSDSVLYKLVAKGQFEGLFF